jgi:hypothetical protein
MDRAARINKALEGMVSQYPQNGGQGETRGNPPKRQTDIANLEQLKRHYNDLQASLSTVAQTQVSAWGEVPGNIDPVFLQNEHLAYQKREQVETQLRQLAALIAAETERLGLVKPVALGEPAVQAYAAAVGKERKVTAENKELSRISKDYMLATKEDSAWYFVWAVAAVGVAGAVIWYNKPRQSIS